MPDTALGQTRAAEQLSGELGWGLLCRRDGHLRPAGGAPPSRGTRTYVACAFIAIDPRSSLAQTRDLSSAAWGRGAIATDGNETRGRWRGEYRASREGIIPGGAEGNAIPRAGRFILQSSCGGAAGRMIRGSTSTVCRRSS